jgi:hypothetical protein
MAERPDALNELCVKVPWLAGACSDHFGVSLHNLLQVTPP